MILWTNKKNNKQINKYLGYKDKKADYFIVLIQILRKHPKKCYYKVYKNKY